MFIYSKDLKPLLKSKGLKYSDLAEKLDVSLSTIKGWASGQYSPTYERHNQVMTLLQEDTMTIKLIKVPILDYVQAGEFTANCGDEPIEYIDIPNNIVNSDNFILKVRGDSMQYDYSDNQLLANKYAKYSLYEDESIIVDPNILNIENLVNKIVVARNEDGATVKLIYINNNKLTLMPLNSKYQNNSSILSPCNAEIVGQVISTYTIRNFS